VPEPLLRILVCDDHAIFRAGLRAVLAELADEAELLEASNVAEALALARAQPDLALALLDLHLPGTDGRSGLRQLRVAHPTLPVVIVSAVDDPDEMRQVLDDGAAGFIPKASSSQQLLAALRLVLSGGAYVPREALAAVRTEPSPAETRRARRRERAGSLTERQLEVLSLMARGLTNREICGVLDIREGTVKTHVAAIFEALEVTNRTEAAVAARELGLKAPGEE
jgi:DNA-binding NarL/FixJ family response regulator